MLSAVQAGAPAVGTAELRAALREPRLLHALRYRMLTAASAFYQQINSTCVAARARALAAAAAMYATFVFLSVSRKIIDWFCDFLFLLRFRAAGEYSSAILLLRGLAYDLSRQRWLQLAAEVNVLHARALAGGKEYEEYASSSLLCFVIFTFMFKGCYGYVWELSRDRHLSLTRSSTNRY